MSIKNRLQLKEVHSTKSPFTAL